MNGIEDKKFFSRQEPKYKTVHLNTFWQRSDIQERTYRNTVLEYKFELTARNLPYLLGDRTKLRTTDNLDIVKFTFHIFMKKDPVTRDDIPVYQINVETGEGDSIKYVNKVDFDDYRSYKGSRISSKIKYDYAIAGWDFDLSNKNPMLFLDMNIALLHAYDNRLGEALEQHFLQEQQRFKDTMQYRDKDGFDKEMYLKQQDNENNYELVEKSSEEPGFDENNKGTRSGEFDSKDIKSTQYEDELILKNFEAPEMVENNQLKFADNIYRVGSFSWVSNVTADGEDRLIDFQIQHVGWIKKFIDGKLYTGIWIKGGFNLPGANRIHHDPTFASDFYELEILPEQIDTSVVNEGRMLFGAIVLLVIIAVILSAFYATAISAQERKMKPPKLPPEPNSRTVMEKDQYKSKQKKDEEYYESYYVDWED
jgi:hypothetical protein